MFLQYKVKNLKGVQALHDFFLYNVILAAYNSLIMHNGHLAQRCALRIMSLWENINNTPAIKCQMLIKPKFYNHKLEKKTTNKTWILQVSRVTCNKTNILMM